MTNHEAVGLDTIAMDDVMPRRRNLRPRKPWNFVEHEAKPQRPVRSVRKTRARISRNELLVYENEEDDDWDAAADDEDEVDIRYASSASLRRRRREATSRNSAEKSKPKQRPIPKLRIRRPKKLLPEDVYGRELCPNQPEVLGDSVVYNPDVPFIAIFLSKFSELFVDFPQALAPQDLEEGLVSETPSESVELLFRRLLRLVLNRKKEIEPGRYNSALSEVHAQRVALGIGENFPQLNWKSKGNAFAELSWRDRAKMLHILAVWSLTSSELVRGILKNMDDDQVKPWISGDEDGNHYYFLGFYPYIDSLERTRFRLYRETNRLLSTVVWEPIASNSTEIIQFLRSHVRPKSETQDGQANETENTTKSEDDDDDDDNDENASDRDDSSGQSDSESQSNTEQQPETEQPQSLDEDEDQDNIKAEVTSIGDDDQRQVAEVHEDSSAQYPSSDNISSTGPNLNPDSRSIDSEGIQTLLPVSTNSESTENASTETNQPTDTPAHAAENIPLPNNDSKLTTSVTESVVPEEPILETDTKAYDLPKDVVEFLLELLPLMQASERVAEERAIREAKRNRRKFEMLRHSQEIARGEGRYAGRTRRKRVDYSEFLRDVTGGGASDGEYENDENSGRKRRLRNRGRDYAWNEPEPESRQQRHARLLTERSIRES